MYIKARAPSLISEAPSVIWFWNPGLCWLEVEVLEVW